MLHPKEEEWSETKVAEQTVVSSEFGASSLVQTIFIKFVILISKNMPRVGVIVYFDPEEWLKIILSDTPLSCVRKINKSWMKKQFWYFLIQTPNPTAAANHTFLARSAAVDTVSASSQLSIGPVQKLRRSQLCYTLGGSFQHSAQRGWCIFHLTVLLPKQLYPQALPALFCPWSSPSSWLTSSWHGNRHQEYDPFLHLLSLVPCTFSPMGSREPPVWVLALQQNKVKIKSHVQIANLCSAVLIHLHKSIHSPFQTKNSDPFYTVLIT